MDFVAIDYEPGDIVRHPISWRPPIRSGVRRAAGMRSICGAIARELSLSGKAVTSDGGESEPAQIDFIVLPPI